MKDFLEFLAAIATPLMDLFSHANKPAIEQDPEEERQIALRLVRAAKDAQARAEIPGP